MEVAAISGHKSLAMLKRYTHLKATKLVRKLEGGKHKGKQAILDNLMPYPAIINKYNKSYQVRLLDFDNLVAEGTCRESAIRMAQNLLMRKILNSMRSGGSAIPAPDQYLETVDEKKLVMIDPLGLDEMTETATETETELA